MAHCAGGADTADRHCWGNIPDLIQLRGQTNLMWAEEEEVISGIGQNVNHDYVWNNTVSMEFTPAS